MAMTLMDAKTNSHSPYAPAEHGQNWGDQFRLGIRLTSTEHVDGHNDDQTDSDPCRVVD